MRSVWVSLHRWLGLFMAGFLFVSGLTGAIIAWDHELDEWLNPELFHARASDQPALSALQLADRLEAADARLRLSYLPLHLEPGHNLGVSVDPRVAPDGSLPELGFDQLALDPVIAEVVGSRRWGEFAFSRAALMPFLYKLHYTLHLPDAWGIELGILLLGIVAMVWVIDCFIALWISFPSRRSWRKSFAFRWRQGGHKRTFDLHRSGGVWIWTLLLLIAVTSVSMNLPFQVTRPLVSLFSPLTPSPFEQISPVTLEQSRDPLLSRAEAIAVAQGEAQRLGIQAPPGGIYHSAEFGLYGVGFFAAGADHGDGGLGNPWIILDARDGRVLSADFPGQGSAGDLFMQLQFPLHSGRILGLPGRILVSLLGLAVATLSVTGVLIWLRKRAGRVAVRQRAGKVQPVTHDEALMQ